MADIIDFRVKNGLVVTTTATIEGATQATSTATGALQIRSGAGIGGNLFVGGLTNIAGATTITNTTNASSTLTGALQVRGGAGIGQDVFIGGNLNVTGSISGTLAGNATTVSTVRQTNNATYFLTFVDSDNASATAESVFTTATLVVNPNTQFVGIGTGTPTATLTVGGGTRISGITTVTNTTNATSTSTGALQVVGGVGVGGDLQVGGSIFGTIAAVVTTATNIAGGGPGMVVYQSSTATTAFVATGTAGTVLVSNGSGSAPSFNNTLTLDSITESTTTATGALQVRGGVGINRSLNVGQSVAVNGTTQATSTVTGALTVAGGAGIRGNLWLGGTLNFFPEASDFANISTTASGNATFFNFNLGDDPGQTDTWRWRFIPSGANEFSAMELDVTSTTTALLSVTGDIAATNIVTSGDISVNGGDLLTSQTTFNLVNTTATTLNIGGAGTNITIGATTGATTVRNATTVSNTTNATSTSAAALVVYGGVGINQDLRVGGTIFGTVGGAVGTATNIANGTAGQVPFQTGPSATSFFGPGTAGNVLVSNGTSAPSYNNTLTLASTNQSGSTNTGALQVAGGAGIAGNLVVGGSSTVTNNLIVAGSTNANSTATGALVVSGGGLGVNGNSYIGGNEFIVGDLEIRGGDLFANVSTTFNLINTTATTINFGGAGTNITIGASASGATTVRHRFTVTDTTAATSTTTGALQVFGGAGIAGSVVVGGSTNIAGDETIGGDLNVNGGDFNTNQTTFNLLNTTATTINFGGVGTNITIGASGSGVTTLRHRFTVTDTTNATSTITGAVSVRGGVSIGQNLFVGGTSASTATITSNAIYVAGGVGINGSLYVQGKSYFQDDVIFSGTSTYVYSTQTLYTDNIVNLHVPAGATGTSHTWTIDDGKDIGHIFHYFTGTDKDAFLGLATGSKFLEWWENGTESNGVYTGTTYGIFRTGGIRLTHTTASSNTITGALTVAGGVGIGGDVWIGGNVNVAGTINASITGVTTTATNLQGGTAGQIPYQTGPGTTNFFGPGTAGNVLVSNGTSVPSYNNTLTLAGTTAASSTQTGALQVRGGIGAGNIFVNNARIISANTDGNTLSTLPLDVQGAWIRIGDATTGFTQTGGIGIKFHDAGNTHWSVAMTGSNFVIAITSSNGDQLLPTSRTDALLIDGSGNITGSANITATGDVAVNGGDLTTNQSTFNLLNATATTINFGGAGTNITIGASASGATTVRNRFTVTDTTNATSTITGALQTYGGLGVGGDFYQSGSHFLNGNIEIRGGTLNANSSTTFNLVNTTATTINFGGAGTNITIGATTGATTVRNDTTVTSITAATSTATGALQVRGGVGIGGALVAGGAGNVGGDLTVGGDLNVNGGDLTTNQTTFNLVNTTATTINFGGAGTNITVGATTGVTTIRNNTTVTSTTAATSTATGAFQVRGGVGVGGDLYVGGTIFGTSSGAGNANNILTTATSTASSYFLTFVDSNNSTAAYEALYTDPGIQFNPSSNDLLLAGDLQVQGGDLTTNQTTFNLLNSTATTINFGGASTALTMGANAAGFVLIQNNSDATSTATGALRVNGGVGVNRDVWVGQRLNVAGDAIVTGDIAVNGGDIITNQTTFNLINTTATTVNFAGASTVLNVGAAGAGYVQIRNNSAASSTATGALRVDGGLGVNGAIYGGNIFSNGSQVIPFKMEEFTASASQTTFTVTGGYVVGTVMVFVNGIFMNNGDFTASNGTTVVLTFARNAGDVVKIVSGGTSSSSNQQQSFSIAMSVALS